MQYIQTVCSHNSWFEDGLNPCSTRRQLVIHKLHLFELAGKRWSLCELRQLLTQQRPIVATGKHMLHNYACLPASESMCYTRYNLSMWTDSQVKCLSRCQVFLTHVSSDLTYYLLVFPEHWVTHMYAYQSLPAYCGQTKSVTLAFVSWPCLYTRNEWQQSRHDTCLWPAWRAELM